MSNFRISYGIDEDGFLSCEIKTTDGFEYEGELFDVILNLEPLIHNLLDAEDTSIMLRFYSTQICKHNTKIWLVYNQDFEDGDDFTYAHKISEPLQKSSYKYVNIMWACMQEALKVWNQNKILSGFFAKLYEYHATQYDELQQQLKENEERRQKISSKIMQLDLGD